MIWKKEKKIYGYSLGNDNQDNKGALTDLTGFPVKINIGSVVRDYRSLVNKCGWPTGKV